VPGVPEACARIVRRCLAKAPKDRYASAQELEWDVRGLLRELEAAVDLEDGPPPPPPTVAPAPVGPTFRPADLEWTALGFTLQPYAEIDAQSAPYRGEPMAGTLRELRERLAAGPGRVVPLVGAAGSGRTVLARQLLADPPATAPRAYVDVTRLAPGARALVQRVARAFGALPKSSSGAGADLDGLLDELRGAVAGRAPALLVVDGLVPDAATAKAVALLSGAARGTTYFDVVLVGTLDAADELVAAAGGEPAVRLLAPAPWQMRDYLVAWLRAAQAAEAPPYVLTGDAALLVWQRAQGSLRRANRIAANMVRLAAHDGRRVLSSWEAWTAPEDEGLPDDHDTSAALHRPAEWLSAEARAVLNACREQVGLPPL
jgi:hypothetical protein